MTRKSNTRGPATPPPAHTARPDPAAVLAPEHNSGATSSNGADPATSANAAGPDGSSADLSMSSVSTGVGGGAVSGDAPGAASGDQGVVGDGSPTAALARTFEILDGHVDIAFIGSMIGQAMNLTEAEWNALWDALPNPVQVRAAELVVGGMRASALVLREVISLVSAPQDETVWIRARSRDGASYRRAGQVWTGSFQTLPIAAELDAVVRADPHLVVEDPSPDGAGEA